MSISWENAWATILSYRADHPAPVDQMGCNSCALSTDSPNPEDFSPISILASFDINDEHSTQSLESLLKPISFFKTKARYVFFTFLRNLLKISAILVDKYNADVPDCLDDDAWHICRYPHPSDFEPVEMGLHKIARRDAKGKNGRLNLPALKKLEDLIPHETWPKVNATLVGFGQTVCSAIKPKCTDSRSASRSGKNTVLRHPGLVCALFEERRRDIYYTNDPVKYSRNLQKKE
ncbi:Endonuclease III-like protein 1 [Mitosporidium daphniae]|uniref:Uncharacterized protein n=1 Tax=Mitosporidium daphniae TaxID=1485682 RepID=A0A098VQQ3_9MICR|nr:uncharacterized protein DI09_3p520 [Mitosporidium daphniae]KGG51290.1 hypothetical protein DI09_3p520 [Mitosporidium daphniae]|eukprot:XP_013237717.1 uncharacterized protein DI09_3p520 [Mitosporidium daphniae]